MRIAYVCSSLSLGGLELNHLRNAVWMQERGHDVKVFAVLNSPLYQKAVQWGLPCSPIKHQRKYYDWFAAFKLASELKEASISHVFFRDNRDMSLIATVKARLGRSIVTAYFMEMQLGIKKTGLLHTLRFRYIDFWFCPLPFLINQVRNWTKIDPSKIKLVPSGMDLSWAQNTNKPEARENLNLPKDNFLFGLIGRFDVQKGQLLVLEAMKLCKNQKFTLVFLGEPTRNENNHVFETMQKWIDENHWETRVFIRPFMDDVRMFYSAIDALIMATKAETFGMVTLEAIAHKVPVLGSNAGGTPDLICGDEFGILFKSLDAHDLAKAMDIIQVSPLTFNLQRWEQHLTQFNYPNVCKSIEYVLD